MDEHILGQTNETFERYKFNARGQMCEEAIDAYVAGLQKTCNFCDCLKDSLLRDRIVFGVRDNGVRKILLWCCPPDVRSKVHVIDEQSPDVEYEVYEDSVLTVYTDESIRHVSTGPLYTEMMLPNKTAIKLHIDSGATVDVIYQQNISISTI